MDRDTVLQLIFEAIHRVNELRPPDQPLRCAEDTVLYGPDGALDSLGLVSLLLDVEEALNAHTGGALVLADEKAMAQHRNPFRSVRSLADYILVRLQAEQP